MEKEEVKLLIKVADKVFSLLDTLIKDTPLSYEEVMKYFLNHKNDDPQIVKGVMIKECTEDGKMALVQTFLNSKNEIIEKDDIPLGRRMTSKAGLDSELLALFKDKNIVVVE
jgi:DNA repair protein RadC